MPTYKRRDVYTKVYLHLDKLIKVIKNHVASVKWFVLLWSYPAVYREKRTEYLTLA